MAGVSASTVSKALNVSSEIPEETRARIEETARRLGYRPNAVAQSLRVGRSHSIGAVTDDDEGMFSTTILRALEHHADQRGFSVILANSLGERARERRHVETFLNKQVDGLIVMDSVVRRRGAPAAEIGDLPQVYVYCYTDDLDVPCIVPDDRLAGRLATEHLLATGRRHLAFLSGPRYGPGAFEASDRRLDGYLEAHATAGLAHAEGLVVAADWNARSGYEAMRRLLDAGDIPDGVVCSNDYTALGALEAIRLSGRSVPDDIAVIGFDNRAVAAGLPVPLSTIAPDYEEIGRIAMDRLLAAIDGAAQHRELVAVPPRLIVRQSTTNTPHPEDQTP